MHPWNNETCLHREGVFSRLTVCWNRLGCADSFNFQEINAEHAPWRAADVLQDTVASSAPNISESDWQEICECFVDTIQDPSPGMKPVDASNPSLLGLITV